MEKLHSPSRPKPIFAMDYMTLKLQNYEVGPSETSLAAVSISRGVTTYIFY